MHMHACAHRQHAKQLMKATSNALVTAVPCLHVLDMVRCLMKSLMKRREKCCYMGKANTLYKLVACLQAHCMS